MTFQELQDKVKASAPKQDWKITVPVDQISDTSVAAIIKRATSGQPILGNPNQVYDGKDRTDKVNPLNNIGFDLDDLIEFKKQNNVNISNLKDKYDRLQADKVSSGGKEVTAEEVATE